MHNKIEITTEDSSKSRALFSARQLLQGTRPVSRCNRIVYKGSKSDSEGCYYNNRGNAYLSINEISKAEKDYKIAIDLEPNNEVFLGNYGNICLSQKKFKQAIEVYNKAIFIDQENDFFYNNRAFAEIKLGEMSAAIESYNHAINLNPHNHIYLKNRANLFMEKKNIKWALDDISKAI